MAPLDDDFANGVDTPFFGGSLILAGLLILLNAVVFFSAGCSPARQREYP